MTKMNQKEPRAENIITAMKIWTEGLNSRFEQALRRKTQQTWR